MVKTRLRQIIAQCSHPGEDDLFLMADGGLGRWRAWRLRSHLKRCWKCRMEVERLRQAVTVVTEFQHAVQREFSPDALGMQQRFAQRLNELPPHTTGQGIFTRPRLLWAAGAMTAALLAVWLIQPPLISADMLIDRASAAEAGTTAPAAGSVSKREFRLRYRTGSARETASELVIWTDPASGRQRQIGRSTEWERYRSILAHNHVEPGRQWLTGTHRSWRNQIVRRQESVTNISLPGGAGAFLIDTRAAGPFATEAITRMELLVRADDGHAVRQTVYVQEPGEEQNYEIEEVAASVVARNSLPPDLFGPEPEGVPAVAASAGGTSASAGTSSPTLPPETTASTEVRARLRVHRQGACLGGRIEYTPGRDGWINVRGEVASEPRRVELVRALALEPYIRISLRTPEEAAEAAISESGQAGAVAPRPPGPQPEATTPLQVVLGAGTTRLTGNEVTALVNSSVSLSGAVMDDVWEMRRLIERFPEDVVRGLSADDRSAVESMIRDHLNGATGKLAGLKSALGPILPACSGCTAPSQPGDLETRMKVLFDSVQQIDAALSGLLQPVTPSEADPQPWLRKLSLACFLADADGQALRDSIDSEFRGQSR